MWEAFSGWLGQEGRALWNGISALIKEISANPLSPSSMWGHLSLYQDVGSDQTSSLLTPVSWIFQPPELRNKYLLFKSHQVYVICYRSANRPRQPNILISKKITISVCNQYKNANKIFYIYSYSDFEIWCVFYTYIISQFRLATFQVFLT